MDGDEVLLLLALLYFKRKEKTCHASIATLCEHMRTTSRNKIVKVIKSLKDKGYINYKRGSSFKHLANEYTIDMNKIRYDIIRASQKNNPEVIITLARKPLTEQQKDIMAEKRATENVTIAHRAEFKNGFEVNDGDGKLINNVITSLKSKRKIKEGK